MIDEKALAEAREVSSALSSAILKNNIEKIAESLLSYWQNHQNELKHSLSSRAP